MSIHSPEAKPIVVRTPEDVIGLVPHLIGFEPTESIVMLTFGASRPFHARVDLPGPENVLETLGSLRHPVIQHNVARVILLAYTHGSEQDARATLEFLAESMPVEVVAALVVTETEFFDVEGKLRRPRPELTGSAIQAAVTLGTSPRASREEIVASIQPGADGAEVNDIVASLLTDSARYDERILGICRENARSQVEYWSATARMTSHARGARVCSLLALAAWQAGDGATSWAAIDRARLSGDTTLAKVVATFLEKAVAPEEWATIRDDLGFGA